MAVPTVPPTVANLKNVALKAFWTGVTVLLSTLIVEIATIDAWWILPLSAGINYALAWVRERYGHTTPDLPPAGPLGQLSTRPQP